MAKLLDNLIIIDVESTCWKEGNFNRPDGQESEIIEIGVCSVDLVKREIAKSEAIFVRPIMSRVSDFCTELTTLTQADVDKGMTLSAACDKLRREYQVDLRAWGSWGDYDRVQFERDLRAKKLRGPFGRTHFNIKALFSIMYGATREMGVPDALAKVGLKLEGTHHRGVDDAKNISRLFLHLLAERNTVNQLPSNLQSVYR